MNKGTAIIGVLLAFVGGYFLGHYTAKSKSGASGSGSVTASNVASIEEQERQLGPGNPSSDRTRVLVGPHDAQKGPSDALVTVVEWSDFECPFCKRAADTVRQIVTNYPKQVRVVFKHNPLPFHKNALPAAEAALAAGEQGKFWEMHDKLFADQKSLNRETFEKYAQELGLDMAKFRAALDSGKFKAQIEADQKQAASVGARGTPTFFVNGKVVRGAQPFEQFKTLIDQEIAYAENLMKTKNIPASAVYAEIMRDAKVGAATAQPDRPVQAVGVPDPAKVYKVPVGDSPSKGPANAKVTIIEFSEFQCPFCARVLPTLKEIEQKYGKDVRIVFKHQPLPMHPQAPLAAEAALAAHEQGKFWEMHDKLFANQRALDRASLEKYAEELKLDLAKFKAALDSGKYKKRVQEDMELASRFGVRGTPSFFINGRPLRGAQPLENFVKLIDEELAKANALAAKGVKDIYAEVIKNGEEKVEAGPMPSAPAQAGEPDPNAVYKLEVDRRDAQKGPETAKVTIVEFSDFQCPFCSRVVPTLKQLVEKYPKDVRVVFKHLPLPMHPQAPLAAEAALAAHEQGKFWPMHDKLFENQRALNRSDLERYAQELGLDMAKFKAALDSGKYKAQVKADEALAAKFGVRGTPSFFINGKFVSGALPFEAFEAKVKEEIAKADALLAKGVKPNALYAEIIKSGLTEVKAAAAPMPPVDTTVYKVDPGNSPSKGNPKAPVTIIEFSDFQCPFCARVVPTLKQIMDTYKNDVRVVFMQLPLPMHPQAPLAAEAALAAHEQGKFWEMHDKLFENQRQLDRASLETYAQQIGLDMAKFKAALDSGKYKAKVDADMKAAQSAGISGTPTFLINGRKVSGALPFDSFKAVIDEELKKAKK